MAQGQTSGLPQAVPVPEPAVREELSRVLSGHEFRSSKRSQDFLRYVVENTLAGHADILKERTIGIEVFARPVSYDPSEDATVRVKAGEVRKRLGIYYSGEGAGNPLRIELPAGTYVPEFRRAESAAVPEHAVAVPEERTQTPHRASLRWVPAVLALSALGLGGLWFWARSKAPVTPLDAFWAPVLKGSAPVSVCAAFVPLLGRDPDKPGDLTLFKDQFVGGGDLIAVSRLSALLTRRNRGYQVRIGNETSLHDLQTAPAIMVGYSLTHWKEISRELRFFIDTSRSPIGITDNGTVTKWVLPNLPPDQHTGEDYAIVSRVFHPDTHAMLVQIAGITQYGTDAASDLVTNTDLMTDALRNAPSDWQKKNLQLVLHVKVISGAPSSPRVVASHYW